MTAAAACRRHRHLVPGPDSDEFAIIEFLEHYADCAECQTTAAAHYGVPLHALRRTVQQSTTEVLEQVDLVVEGLVSEPETLEPSPPRAGSLWVGWTATALAIAAAAVLYVGGTTEPDAVAPAPPQVPVAAPEAAIEPPAPAPRPASAAQHPQDVEVQPFPEPPAHVELRSPAAPRPRPHIDGDRHAVDLNLEGQHDDAVADAAPPFYDLAGTSKGPGVTAHGGSRPTLVLIPSESNYGVGSTVSHQIVASEPTELVLCIKGPDTQGAWQLLWPGSVPAGTTQLVERGSGYLFELPGRYDYGIQTNLQKPLCANPDVVLNVDVVESG